MFFETEPPEIQLDVKLLAGLTARAGTKIELPADVKGQPDPRVKWTKADLVLRPDDRITIDTQPGHSKLSVSKTTRGDTATYIIEAVNACGRATATVDVNILGTRAHLIPALSSITSILPIQSDVSMLARLEVKLNKIFDPILLLR